MDQKRQQPEDKNPATFTHRILTGFGQTTENTTPDHETPSWTELAPKKEELFGHNLVFSAPTSTATTWQSSDNEHAACPHVQERISSQENNSESINTDEPLSVLQQKASGEALLFADCTQSGSPLPTGFPVTFGMQRILVKVRRAQVSPDYFSAEKDLKMHFVAIR